MSKYSSSIVPAMSREVGIGVPLVWLRIDAPDCHRTLSLVWRDAYLPTAATRFRDFAATHFPDALRAAGLANA